MRSLTVPTLALAALTMSVAFGAPGAGVSAQNVGEKFTAFAIELEQRSQDGDPRHQYRQMVHGCRAGATVEYPCGGEGPVSGESGAAEGSPEDAEGGLHSHDANAGLGRPLCAAEPDGGWRATDRRRHRSPDWNREARNQPEINGLPVHGPRDAPEQGRQG